MRGKEKQKRKKSLLKKRIIDMKTKCSLSLISEIGEEEIQGDHLQGQGQSTVNTTSNKNLQVVHPDVLEQLPSDHQSPGVQV